MGRMNVLPEKAGNEFKQNSNTTKVQSQSYLCDTEVQDDKVSATKINPAMQVSTHLIGQFCEGKFRAFWENQSW